MSDPVVLSYGDALLRASDLALLLSPNAWLNDKILGFVFEYWEKEEFQQFMGRVSLITPDVAQLIKLLPDLELDLMLEPLSLHTKDLIVLVVNDSSSRAQAGGSHWSVLTYDKMAAGFSHYDSALNANLSAARQCASKMAAYLNRARPGAVEEEERVRTEPVPQQRNGHDCGVFAACFAEYLIRRACQLEPRPLEAVVTPPQVQSWRERWRDRVQALAGR